jgi:hypothetical protein
MVVYKDLITINLNNLFGGNYENSRDCLYFLSGKFK